MPPTDRRLDLGWIRERLAQHQPVVQETGPRRAAVACVLRSAEPCSEMLFILRAQHEHDPWAGHMAFPGGRVEETDPSPLHAVRRETLEEVGIDLARSSELLGQFDDVIASAGGRVIPMAITPFVFLLTGPVSLRLSLEEVQEAHWVPVQMLLDPAHASTVPWTLRGQRYDLPCIRVFERVIWGLTYQMLMRLFTVLRWDRDA